MATTRVKSLYFASLTDFISLELLLPCFIMETIFFHGSDLRIETGSTSIVIHIIMKTNWFRKPILLAISAGSGGKAARVGTPYDRMVVPSVLLMSHRSSSW